ncbi:hypothetical protein [Erwinia tasmaniensis]|uniref:Uncharacterized protein n=1 Tax=Erwinia tasmaniensis (strain DSM 17950 / CFBP 7177 / CIP 109463 / NCPPB 4357 / Et1/99) TaxID=465817 RepID=B2VJU5_ERWT9|nr:hypothetical protein [Erwinia tasmaniensis]CAO98290.1 hypothetical protein ETA_32440 [Erwinia tasmaniensis Et1/99]
MSAINCHLLYLKACNVLGATISDYDARKILKKLESVVDSSVGADLIGNSTFRKALENKAIKTKNKTLRDNILRVSTYNLGSSECNAKIINAMVYTRPEESKLITTNKINNAFLKGNVPGVDDIKRQEIAQKILDENKDNLPGLRIKMELERKGIPLKLEVKLNELLGRRSKGVSKINKIISETNTFQAKINNKPLDGELVPADREKTFDLRTSKSREEIMKIDKILDDRREATEIIMVTVEKYLREMPLVLSERSNRLINEYNRVGTEDTALLRK